MTQSGLQDSDLPVLFKAADATSLDGQRHFLRANQVSLALLIVAAIAGAFVWKFARTGSADWAGVVAAVAFIGTFAIRIYLLVNRPERLWYRGRAVAESVKTLAWRYACGGEPFSVDEHTSSDADRLLALRLRETLTDMKDLALKTQAGEQVTKTMRDLRACSLIERKAAYEAGRVDDQRDWYTRKAEWNEKRAGYWSVGLLSIEFLGMVAAVIKAIGVLEIDLLGLACTVVAAGMSWVQIKQHSALAAAYSLAAQELATVKLGIAAQRSEKDWAHFIDEAEEAISREHTLWRASRA